MTVEIRRRAALVATVATLAGLLAAGYLWRFAVVGGWVSLALGLALSCLAVAYGVAWWAARAPLLLADATGLRVRLGTAWVGVQWEAVDRVEVDTPGRVKDGRVVVLPSDEALTLGAAGRGTRLAAACNRRLYRAALAVPYGLATSESVDDVAGQFELLAGGRAAVAVLDGSKRAPDVAADLEADLRPPASGIAAPLRPPGAAVAAGAATAMPVGAPPLRRLPSAVDAPAARREDVTIAMRREAVDGTLALSAPADEVRTEELPEIAELRRATTEPELGEGAADGGNVALIIDATTDLSARAMRKVRRAAPAEAEPPEDDSPTDEHLHPPAVLYIGADLRQARESLGMTVDDLADRTRIRAFVIERMESDDFAPCGGDFYARGHLRMLARVLGIASEPLIATYDERFGNEPVSLRAVFDAELATGTTGMVRGGAAGANWAGLIAAVVILVVIWGAAKYFAGA